MKGEMKVAARKYRLWLFAPSVTLSLTWLVSSLMKCVNIHSFASETMLYLEAYVSPALAPASMALSCMVCSLELLLAMLLLHKRYVWPASVVSVLLLSFFACLTGANLIAPAEFGQIESCGCFGELIHFTPGGSFVKSVVLCLVAFVSMTAAWKIRGGEGPHVSCGIWGNACMCLCVSCVPVVYCLMAMSQIDDSFYLVGYIVVSVLIVGFVVMSACLSPTSVFVRISCINNENN